MILAYYEVYILLLDITVRNEVRKVALWISNWIVYPSCGLLKTFLLYILMLHLSGEYLCIMAGRSLLLVSPIFTDLPLCARLGFENGECESHEFGVARCVRGDTPTGPKSSEQVFQRAMLCH